MSLIFTMLTNSVPLSYSRNPAFSRAAYPKIGLNFDPLQDLFNSATVTSNCFSHLFTTLYEFILIDLQI